MSPTFAAGLGIVIAAMLVLPMTGTIFHYTLPQGVGSATCPREVCATPPAGGGHAAIKGGKRYQLPRPPRHRPGPAATAQATPPAGDPTPSPSSQVSLDYQTVKQWPGGFMGQITISFAAGAASGGWRLRFGYPVADIESVWGGIWVPHGRHHALVRGEPPPDAPPGQPINVWFVASGAPSVPADCTFNGQGCHLGG